FYGDYSPTTTETIFGGFNWSHQFNDDWSVKHQFSVNQRSVNSPSYTHAQLAGSKKYLQDFWDGIGFTHQTLDGLPEGSYVWRQHDALRSQNNTYSTNLDLVGHFDTYDLKHTLLMGGDYYRLDVDSLDISESSIAGSYISLNNPVHPGTPFVPFDTRSNVTSKTDQYGLYIQDQIKLPYGFQVMGGIRYQYIDQNKVEQDAVTPRVGLLWQPKKWLSLYTNYVESFGANSGRVFPGTPIPPTSSEQYEGGIKAEFFEGKLRVNLAYYNLTKTNIAVGDPNIFHNCGTGGFVSGQGSDCFIALGEVRSRGPELDITGEILPGWNVIATWSNTDIIVTKSNAKNDPVISAAGGLSYTPGGRLPNVPRNTGSLWSTYEVQDGDYKGFIFGGGATLRDGLLPYDVDGTGGYKTPGYATFDLMAGYSRQIGDAKVSVQLNVDNLLDKRYFNSFSALNNLQGAWVDFSTPRTFMGQVSVQY
ncbi:MAG: TonB-dependent receptor, partial [Methyloglobulus sp.]|nr:TonB-dependent receptor [Methyloglobulus sp.]